MFHRRTRMQLERSGPMRGDEFDQCDEGLVNVSAMRWPATGALARSQGDCGRLLSQVPKTPNHFVYTMQDGAAGQPVGALWFALLGAGEAWSDFVYNVRVGSAFRGRGWSWSAAASGSLALAGHHRPALVVRRGRGLWVHLGFVGIQREGPARTLTCRTLATDAAAASAAR